MRTSAGWLVVGVVMLGTAGLLAEAKGQVRLKRVTFAVADAIAYRTDSGIAVALLARPLDRQAAAKDRTIDDFDIMRAGGASITLKIDNDGGFNCIDFTTDEGGGSSCSSTLAAALTLTARTHDRVAGTFKLNADGESADVTFDLKVESEAARAGAALPADGGEPGQAVLAHFVALEKGDFQMLKTLASPEQRAEMEASEKSGEAREMFELLRAMSPSKVRVVGGMVDGDRATVDFEGVAEGQPVKGVADVVRIGGKWYVTGASTR